MGMTAMSKFPSQLQDKFNLRFPDGMRDAIAERAKRNGRSMNSEIVQILQDALDSDSVRKDSDIADFGRLKSGLDGITTPEDKEKYLAVLDKKDPFTAAILRETEAHNVRLVKILGKHMGYDDDNS